MVSREEVMAAINSPDQDFLRWASGQGLCADLAWLPQVPRSGLTPGGGMPS